MSSFPAETIFALATPLGVSGIAVVRVSGGRAKEGLAQLLGGRSELEPRRACVRLLKDPQTGVAIDQALLLWFPGPQSFTGEDSVEYHLHGSQAVLQVFLRILSGFEGYRLALPGEFTKRAFLNGRLSLLEVEGLSDLFKATTYTQHQQALWHLSGQSAAIFDEWKQVLLRALAYAEVMIDFTEEGDVVEDTSPQIVALLQPLQNTLSQECAKYLHGEKIRDGIRITIAGPPNAGKSSLMNCLAQRDVAIVSPLAGTTRDALEVVYDLQGIACVITDTAGIREQTPDPLEKEGMKRAQHHLSRADIILWLQSPDAQALPPSYSEKRLLLVWSKADLAPPPSMAFLPISVYEENGLQSLLNCLKQEVSALTANGEPGLIIRERHRVALQEALYHIDVALDWKKAVKAPEILAEHIRLAARALERVVGRLDTEDVLGVVFSEFCIGK